MSVRKIIVKNSLDIDCIPISKLRSRIHYGQDFNICPKYRNGKIIKLKVYADTDEGDLMRYEWKGSGKHSLKIETSICFPYKIDYSRSRIGILVPFDANFICFKIEEKLISIRFTSTIPIPIDLENES